MSAATGTSGASGPSPGYARLALLLALLAMIGPFSTDMYLPSFPAIGHELAATPMQVQQSLTAYFATFGFMMLWHGAISDALGRRPVVLAGLALYGVASLVLAFVGSIEALWIWRAVQGVFGGVGIVVGRAIVRDLYQGPAAQRLMSHIGMVFAIAPALAPIIGGVLEINVGWRANFWLLAGLSAALWFACWRALPETLPVEKRQSLHPTALWRGYRAMLADPAFLTPCLAISLNFGGFFIYVLSAPVFILQHLHLREDQFAALFVPAMTGMLAGSWLSARRAGSHRPAQAIHLGFRWMALAAGGNLLLCFVLLPAGAPAVPLAVLPMALYTFGMAQTLPGLTLRALDRFPERRGMASSVQAAIHSASNTLVAALLAPLLWADLRALATGMAVLLLLGFVAARQHAGKEMHAAKMR